MAVYTGLSIGPPLGGFLVDNLGWRWIFLVNLPIGVILFLWTYRLMPRTEREGAAAPRIDLAGVALLGVFLVCLLVPLTFGPGWGWTSLSVVGAADPLRRLTRRVRHRRAARRGSDARPRPPAT